MADAPRSNLPDAVAVRRLLERLAPAPAPWLHGEIARRMAARLPVIRVIPSTVVEWWGHLGASGDALTAAYPKARRVVVEPTPSLGAASRSARAAPWWRRGRAGRA
jgi:malonyl-CoA O-methyltransferase